MVSLQKVFCVATGSYGTQESDPSHSHTSVYRIIIQNLFQKSFTCSASNTAMQGLQLNIKCNAALICITGFLFSMIFSYWDNLTLFKHDHETSKQFISKCLLFFSNNDRYSEEMILLHLFLMMYQQGQKYTARENICKKCMYSAAPENNMYLKIRIGLLLY